MKVVLHMQLGTNMGFRLAAFALVGFFSFAMSLATTAGAQEIFRWVDKDGKVHYGDMQPPPAEGKNVQTKKIQDSVIEQDAVPYGVSTAMKNNPVTLYANSCGEACVNAKALLARRGIPFTEKNPESDAAAATTLKAMIGALQVPTIVIGANSLAGYEEESWNTALNAAGYPRNNPNLRQGAAKAGPKVVTPAPAVN
jgi:glutaredoxin